MNKHLDELLDKYAIKQINEFYNQIYVDILIYEYSSFKIYYENDNLKMTPLSCDTQKVIVKNNTFLNTDDKKPQFDALFKEGEVTKELNKMKHLIEDYVTKFIYNDDDDEKTVPYHKLPLIDNDEAKYIFGDDFVAKPLDPWYDPYHNSYIPKPTPQVPAGCSHEYVQYTGLHEQFYHCKKCGKRQ